jgi:LysM repeat protein
MRNRLCLILFCGCTLLFAQKPERKTRAEYILMYKDLAMEEMKRTGIPSSITLAQGILESGDGNSRLATKANNHFGIKCHDWDGPSINHDDDKKNECFRKYNSVEQSFRDHSDFLTSRTRYAELFEYAPDDYKSWARGLKETGYATSPTYAKALIQVVEDNALYEYDQQVLLSVKTPGKQKSRTKPEKNIESGKRVILYNNRIKYVLADSNDSFDKIGQQLFYMRWQLPRYNEMPENAQLNMGDIVYIQPKRNRAAMGIKVHVVQEGETMHSISQKYGVKELKLRERNNIPANAEPNAGVAILLRNKVRSDVPMTQVREKTASPVKKNQDETNTGDDEEFIIEFDLGD